MKNGLYFVVFAAGAVVGSSVTWHYVKKKYEKIAQEEIDSVKEIFRKKEACRTEEKASEASDDNTKRVAEQAKNKPDLKDLKFYSDKIEKLGYGGTGMDENKMKEVQPYVIPPEEFGSLEDYEEISLTYYADGILTDENDEIVDNVEDTVGDALNHFGEYEDDSVFVRCDERKCDYEILLDQRTFAEVVGSSPNKVEV